MQHDYGRDDQVKKWLKNAHSDLALASIDLPDGVMYEQLCFHAQQAAEKSIKALLIHLSLEFPFSHNIQLLIGILPADIKNIPIMAEVISLTPYAVLTRYPGEIDIVTEDKYSEAIQVSKSVVEFVESYVSQN